MRKPALMVAAVYFLWVCGFAMAADVAAGKAKFALCAGCHGPTGAGNEALNYPRLAGLDKNYVAKQLREFKSGARDTPMAATMKAMTTDLSEADINNLAAYVATLK